MKARYYSSGCLLKFSSAHPTYLLSCIFFLTYYLSNFIFSASLKKNNNIEHKCESPASPVPLIQILMSSPGLCSEESCLSNCTVLYKEWVFVSSSFWLPSESSAIVRRLMCVTLNQLIDKSFAFSIYLLAGSNTVLAIVHYANLY